MANYVHDFMLANILSHTHTQRERCYTPSLLQMEPLIKESTTRLTEKIGAAAENGETVEALQ